MDARQYLSKVIKPDTVRDAPILARIANVFEEERYNRLCLELDSGAEFALNAGNTATLIKNFGSETDEWIGREVEFFLGTYKDWKMDPPEEKETVRVRGVVPINATANGGAPTALPDKKADDMDDSIPF
jgi:hypothetical protein